MASEYYHAELGHNAGFPTVTLYTKEIQPIVQGVFGLGQAADGDDDLMYAYRPDASLLEHVTYSRKPQGNNVGMQVSPWSEIDPAAINNISSAFLDDLLLSEYDECAAAADPAACRQAARDAVFGSDVLQVSQISINGTVSLGIQPAIDNWLASYWYFVIQAPNNVAAGILTYNFYFAPNQQLPFAGHPAPPNAGENTQNVLVDIGAAPIHLALANAIDALGSLSASTEQVGDDMVITVTRTRPGPVPDDVQVMIDPPPPNAVNDQIVSTVAQGSLVVDAFDFTVVQQGGQQGSDTPAPVAATRISDGVYRADFVIPSNVSSETLYEKWEVGPELLKGHDGGYPVRVKQWHTANQEFVPVGLYITSITNLRSKYSKEVTPRFRVFTKKRDQKPNVVTKNSGNVSGVVIPNIYYSLHRISDGYEIIPFDPDNNIDNHTLLSYDKDGSYFDLDMGMLEEGYSYGIKLFFLINGTLEEQPEIFKFRVE